MKSKILVFLFSLLTGITLSQPITINIKLDKEEYLTYEPIILLIEIKNETNSKLPYYFDLFNKNFKLQVTFNGEKIKCYEGDVPEGIPRILILDSNSSSYYYYPIISVFGCTNSLQEKGLFLEHLIAGNYTVELEYNFGKIVLNNNLDLVIKSNILKFKVKDPHNETHRAQLDKYIDLMKDLDNYKNIKLYTKKINKIIKLDEHSPYSILAQYSLANRYKGQGQISEYRKLVKKACNSFPESFVSLTYAMYDKKFLSMMADSEELKGKMIQKLCKKIKESQEK